MEAGVPTPALKNPDLLLVDADALFQLLIVNRMTLLRFVKRKFHIQPAIVEAVEAEVRKSKRFRARFRQEFQKSLDNGTVLVVDSRTLPAFVTKSAPAVLDMIQTNGLEYEQRGLDYGEAYTFAAAVALDVPVISNDKSAVLTARKRALPLPKYLLRMYDVLVLCHQSGELSTNDCDGIRQQLTVESEFVPAAFSKCSFNVGLPNFYPRILDGAKPALGAIAPLSDLDVRLTLFAFQS